MNTDGSINKATESYLLLTDNPESFKTAEDCTALGWYYSRLKFLFFHRIKFYSILYTIIIYFFGSWRECSRNCKENNDLLPTNRYNSHGSSTTKIIALKCFFLNVRLMLFSYCK